MFSFITTPRHEISSFSCLHNLHPYKKDKDRRKCKGRRCSFGGRIDSVPCRASYFASVDFEEKDELILIFQIIPWCSLSYKSNRPVQTASVARKWQKFLSPNKSDDLFIFLCFSSFCNVHITSGLLLQYEYVEYVDTKGVSKLCELAKIGALSDDSALSYLFVIYTFKKNLYAV